VIFIVGLLLIDWAQKQKARGIAAPGLWPSRCERLGRGSDDGLRPGQGEVVERGAHAQSALAAGESGNGGHAFLRVDGSGGVTVKAAAPFSTACADDKRVIILRK
jgi:hypothetical protein